MQLEDFKLPLWIQPLWLKNYDEARATTTNPRPNIHLCNLLPLTYQDGKEVKVKIINQLSFDAFIDKCKEPKKRDIIENAGDLQVVLINEKKYLKSTFEIGFYLGHFSLKSLNISKDDYLAYSLFKHLLSHVKKWHKNDAQFISIYNEV